MSKPYSMDLRERVVAAVETGGMSRRQAAAHFGVSYSAAIAWVDRLRKTGSLEPSQIGGYKPRTISGAHHDGWCSAAGRRILPCAALSASWRSAV
jgi:putative transposase